MGTTLSDYFEPNKKLTIENVIAALKEKTRGYKLLVAGDLNVKLLETEEDWRGKEIAGALTTKGLEEMLAHLLPHRRPWCRDGRTRRMVWAGREVRSRTDYILGTDRRLF